jgi:chromosome segregation ATPase
MVDNSAALRQVRRRDSRTKRRQAFKALETMVEAGEPITFPAVARRAGVSVSLLYADAELAGRIGGARARQRQAGQDRAWQLPIRSLVTEASLRADLANAKEQNRQLVEELTALKHRLARDLGAEADVVAGRQRSPLLDQLEERAAELEADNHQLRERVRRLEADIRELTDTLEAARGLNRDLMQEVNRSPAPNTAELSKTNRRRKESR